MKSSTLLQFCLVILLLFFSGTKIQAQQNADLIMGDRFYDRFEFADALYYYELVYEQMPNNAAITRRIADTYRRMGQLPMSAEWYRKTLEIDLSQPDDMLHYGEALKCLQEYDQAIEWFGRYNAVVPTDRRVKSHLKDPLYYRDLQADSLKYVMKKLDINTEYPAIGVCRFERGQYLISSMRLEIPTAEQKKKWEHELPYLDVYLCDLSEDDDLVNPVKLDKNVNCKYHDGPVFYCEKDHTLYITRNNIRNGKPVRDKKGNVNLKIYSATMQDGIWEPAQELKFNGDNFSNGHPCLTKDGNFMYFVSNCDGGFGGTDIYVSQRVPEGWTEPINLGPNVNTEGDEMFPYIASNGALYFASNGWAGLGGLDVFRSDLSAGKWTAATNLGYPINSNQDDFSILYNNNDDSGFFCSNRDGNGNDDVFFFNTLSLMKMILAGVIHSPDPDKSLAGEKVLITSALNGKVYETSLNDKEEFTFQADPGDHIQVSLASEEFAQDKAIISYHVPSPLTDPFANIGTHYATPGKLDSRYAGLGKEGDKNAVGSKQNTSSGTHIPTEVNDEETFDNVTAASIITDSASNPTGNDNGVNADPKSTDTTTEQNTAGDITTPGGGLIAATAVAGADAQTDNSKDGSESAHPSDNNVQRKSDVNGETSANAGSQIQPGSSLVSTETGVPSDNDLQRKAGVNGENSAIAGSELQPGASSVVNETGVPSDNDLQRKTGVNGEAATIPGSEIQPGASSVVSETGVPSDNDLQRKAGVNGESATITGSELQPGTSIVVSESGVPSDNDLQRKSGANGEDIATGSEMQPGANSDLSENGVASDNDLQRKSGVNGEGTTTPGNEMQQGATSIVNENGIPSDNDLQRKSGVDVAETIPTTNVIPAVAHGIVLDGDTQAGIPFASVTYTASDGTEHTVMTDAKGKFIITDDVPSRINIKIDKLDYLSCNADVTLSDSPSKVAPTKVKIKKPFVPTMVRVSGVVNGEKMTPLKGVIVTCTNSDGSTVSVTTDSNGKYSIKTYEQKGAVFSFEKEEYEIDSQVVDIVAATTTGTQVNPKSGNSMAQTYDRAIDVSGTVINKETNLPITDVLVTVKNSDGTSTTAVTDAEGNYTMKTFSQYSALITFEKNGYMIGTQTQDITGENVSGIILDISLKPNSANTTLMTGNVIDPETNQPVVGAKVTFKGEDGSISESYTDNLGRYTMNVNVVMKAKLTIEKDGYEFSSTDISTNGKPGRSELKLNVNLKKADPSKQAVAMSNAVSKKTDYEHVVDLTALNIDNVLFDYDKAYIREDAKPTLNQIQELLVQFPEAILIINTHSDSRGSTAYNQQLSMSRAMSIKGYLLKQGISLNRMRIEYFGETRPLNGCIDDVPCNEEEYEVNRRAEFMLVSPVKLTSN